MCVSPKKWSANIGCLLIRGYRHSVVIPRFIEDKLCHGLWTGNPSNNSQYSEIERISRALLPHSASFSSPKVQFQFSRTTCDNAWLKMAYAQVLGVWSMKRLLYVHCWWCDSLSHQCWDRQLQSLAYKLWGSWSSCWEWLQQCNKELEVLLMILRTSMLNTAHETWRGTSTWMPEPLEGSYIH